jgi:hypothetical protein
LWYSPPCDRTIQIDRKNMDNCDRWRSLPEVIYTNFRELDVVCVSGVAEIEGSIAIS